jgi:hypothetical protein
MHSRKAASTLLRHARMALALLLATTAGLAMAGEPEYRLRIEGHRFDPPELLVRAGEKLRLLVENADKTAEEFESYALNREKIIAPGQTAVIYVGPLKPGRYEFFGDFHPATARGWLVAQ